MRDGHQRRHDASEETWRVFRIMAEFVEGFELMSRLGPAVTVYGSSRTEPSAPSYQQAVTMGRRLAERQFSVITGGGPGIMEAANRGAFEAGGTSVGLNISIPTEQVANKYITYGLSFDYFFARKVMLVRFAQALVCFPGGFGTLDELFESLTLMQTHKTEPAPVVLMDSAFWNPLVDWMRGTQLERYATISPQDFDLFMVTDDVDQAVEHIVEKSAMSRTLYTHPQRERIVPQGQAPMGI